MLKWRSWSPQGQPHLWVTPSVILQRFHLVASLCDWLPGPCHTPLGQERAFDVCKPRVAYNSGPEVLRSGCWHPARLDPLNARFLQLVKDEGAGASFLGFWQALVIFHRRCRLLSAAPRPMHCMKLTRSVHEPTFPPSSAALPSSPLWSQEASSLPSGGALSGREVTVDEGNTFEHLSESSFIPRPQPLKLKAGNLPPPCFICDLPPGQCGSPKWQPD